MSCACVQQDTRPLTWEGPALIVSTQSAQGPLMWGLRSVLDPLMWGGCTTRITNIYLVFKIMDPKSWKRSLETRLRMNNESGVYSSHHEPMSKLLDEHSVISKDRMLQEHIKDKAGKKHWLPKAKAYSFMFSNVYFSMLCPICTTNLHVRHFQNRSCGKYFRIVYAGPIVKVTEFNMYVVIDNEMDKTYPKTNWYILSRNYLPKPFVLERVYLGRDPTPNKCFQPTSHVKDMYTPVHV